jgi:uncharacterized protein (DUF1800 family)
MSVDITAAIAANRFGLGARPGELARIGPARGWLKGQLRGAAPLVAGDGLKSSKEILQGAADMAAEQRELGKAGREDLKKESLDSSDPAAAARARVLLFAMKLPAYYRPLYVADVRARVQSAITTDRPFVERLVHFWSNHFAVSVDKIAVLGLAGPLEREAIRPHVLGRFSDMLLAVEQHPAMLLFLDNVQSVGPNSPLLKRFGDRPALRNRQLGLNENLAREILELHTLGVNGGYTQADVTSFAKVITGWSAGAIRGGPLARFDDGKPGEFSFRAALHEPGTQTVVGKRYAQEGVAQGEAVLHDLAVSPATAKFLATKLARHFIADDPPPAAVQRVATAYLKSGGDLPTVYAALIDSPEAWLTADTKYKSPQDYVYSVYRGLELPLPQGQQALGSFQVLGQQHFLPGSPAGWPDRSADWDGSSALMKRIELANQLAQRVGSTRDAAALAPQLLGATLGSATTESIARAASAPQALALLLTAPEFMRR